MLKLKIFLLIVIPYILCLCLDSYSARAYTVKEVVASTICAEAVGEGYVGMYAVANVIANRSNKNNITPYNVVTEKNQFYGYTSKNREELYLQGKEYCDYLANNILKLDDITGGALYIRRIGEKKRKWHLRFCLKLKNHLFYK